MYLLAANFVLVLHLAFIGLVLLGGLVVLRRPRFAFIHLPAAVWGVLVEAMGWYCPLTDLEDYLLRRTGEAGYATGFLERYLLALIYPEGLTREVQWMLAGVVVVVNAGIYGWVLIRRQRSTKRRVSA